MALIFLAPERRLNLGMWENLHIFQAEALKKKKKKPDNGLKTEAEKDSSVSSPLLSFPKDTDRDRQTSTCPLSAAR